MTSSLPERYFGPRQWDGAGPPVGILSLGNGLQRKAELLSSSLRQLNEASESGIDEGVDEMRRS